MTDSFNPNQKRGHPNNRGSWVAGDNSMPDEVMPPVTPLIAPLPSVEATLHKQRWAGAREDQIQDVGKAEFDLQAVLDTFPLERVETLDESGDNDFLYYAATEAGLVEPHDGPFELGVDADELEVYVEARRSAGRAEPIRSSVLAPVDEVKRRIHSKKLEASKLEMEIFDLNKTGLHSTIARHHPTATEYSIYNAVDDDGESQFEVFEIRSDSDVLWSSDDERTTAEFTAQMRDFSTNLDRLGIEHFAQTPDDDHDNAWYGGRI